MGLGTHIKHWLLKVFVPGRWMGIKYRAFKDLLRHDQVSHEVIAELESIFYDLKRVDFSLVSTRYVELVEAVSGIIENLVRMSLNPQQTLQKRLHSIDSAIRRECLAAPTDSSPPYVLSLEAIPPGSQRLVGGKAAHLAEIARAVHLPVPPGFVITAQAFHYFCDYNRLRPEIAAHLARLDIFSVSSLEATAAELAVLVQNAVLPPALHQAIAQSYRELAAAAGEACRLSVRSSAVGEDSQTSFAGQYRSLLNVTAAELSNAYKQVIASKYAPRALYYRIDHGLLEEETPMAVLVLTMIDARASGVLYSRNPVKPDCDSIMLYSVWGLGELLVSGEVAPDLFELSREPAPQVLTRQISSRSRKAVLGSNGHSLTVALSAEEAGQPSLDDAGARQLGLWALQLEDYFHQPQDVEWCQGSDGRLVLLQSRPLQIEPPENEAAACQFAAIPNAVRLTGGVKAASGVGTGAVFIALRPADLDAVPPNAVLVAPTTSPDFVKIIDRLQAVITDVGSSAGHFASIAREFGVPTLVNTREATKLLQAGEVVTVFADAGKVYAGTVEGLLNAPCAPKSPVPESSFRTRLRSLLDAIAPLQLVDPQDPGFVPGCCRTMHDIIRFAHEKALQEMFFFGAGRGRTIRGAKKLLSPIPILLYVVDLGQGLRAEAQKLQEIPCEAVCNPPFLAIWKGLSHPDIYWAPEIRHFDWQAMDQMSAGIFGLESPALASYALLSQDYLNLNVHFGYHFVVVDTLCGPIPGENYISLHFKGGGAAPENRMLRVRFLELVLQEYGFSVQIMGDVINAQLRRAATPTMEEKLEMIGRLLGCTRLLDMILKDEATTVNLANEFLKGNYRLSPIGGEQVRIPKQYFHRQM
jgi:pyruvate, water dikinase